MVSIWQALQRLGVTALTSILDPEISYLLRLLGGTTTTASLASLLVDQIGATELLLVKQYRDLVLEALPKDDAERLVRLLGLRDDGSPWAALTSRQFRRGSRESEVLFSFFALSPGGNTFEEFRQTQVSVRPAYPLFQHQIQAARGVSELLKDGSRPRVLLHMPTGAGKTRTAMNVIAEKLRSELSPRSVVLWLAHNEELCEQGVEEFIAAWSSLGNREVPLIRFFGDAGRDVVLSNIGEGFVVAGLQLLYARSKTEQGQFLSFANRVRLIVMDEAHMALAPSYQHLLKMLAADPTTAVLGLSATPGRSTLNALEDVALASFFNRNKVTLLVPGYANPVEFLQKEGYLARIEFERIPYAPNVEFTLTAEDASALREGFDLPNDLIRRLGADVQRNFLILQRIINEAESGAKIIVFGCSVEHAKLLSGLLVSQGLKAAVVTSETRPDRRRQIIREYRDTDEIQILTNYGVLTTGFDAPRTGIAVITRPTKSVVLYSQMVGRAARGVRAGGNKVCKIITVVDAIPGFRGMAEAFTYWDDVWE